MHKYYYSIIGRSLQIEKGSIFAESQKDAAIKLGSHFILSIKKAFSTKYCFKNDKNFWNLFFMNLSTLINNGFTISSSLEVMLKESSYNHYRTFLKEIYRLLSNGHSLSYSLQYSATNMPHKNYVVPLIKQAEASGELGEILNEINDFLEEKQLFINDLKNALIHPFVILLTFFIFFALVNFFVIPQFESMFLDLKYTTGHLLRAFVFVNKALVFSSLGIISFLVFLYKTNKYKKLIYYITYYCPIIKHIYQKTVLLMFFKYLSLLLKKDFSLYDSLSLIQGSLLQKNFSEKIKTIKKTVANGESFSKSINILDGISYFHIQLISAGEKSANLSKTLSYISNNLQKEIKISINRSTKFIEPLLIIILGLWLGITILLIFAPLFKLIKSISYF